jgi:hypothetical protein
VLSVGGKDIKSASRAIEVANDGEGKDDDDESQA